MSGDWFHWVCSVVFMFYHGRQPGQLASKLVLEVSKLGRPTKRLAPTWGRVGGSTLAVRHGWKAAWVGAKENFQKNQRFKGDNFWD